LSGLALKVEGLLRPALKSKRLALAKVVQNVAGARQLPSKATRNQEEQRAVVSHLSSNS